jgi:hypothetical protein
LFVLMVSGAWRGSFGSLDTQAGTTTNRRRTTGRGERGPRRAISSLSVPTLFRSRILASICPGTPARIIHADFSYHSKNIDLEKSGAQNFSRKNLSEFEG